MTRLQLILNASAIALTTGLGLTMAFTNPERKAYEQYASQTLNTYLKENTCSRPFPGGLGALLQSQCYSLIDTTRPYLTQVIAQKTTRQNFILFSIYQTDLSIPSALPDYQVRTLGVLQTFYTYDAEEL